MRPVVCGEEQQGSNSGAAAPLCPAVSDRVSVSMRSRAGPKHQTQTVRTCGSAACRYAATRTSHTARLSPIHTAGSHPSILRTAAAPCALVAVLKACLCVCVCCPPAPQDISCLLQRQQQCQQSHAHLQAALSSLQQQAADEGVRVATPAHACHVLSNEARMPRDSVTASDGACRAPTPGGIAAASELVRAREAAGAAATQVAMCEGAASEAVSAERGVRSALLGAQQRLSEALQITAALGQHLREVSGRACAHSCVCICVHLCMFVYVCAGIQAYGWTGWLAECVQHACRYVMAGLLCGTGQSVDLCVCMCGLCLVQAPAHASLCACLPCACACALLARSLACLEPVPILCMSHPWPTPPLPPTPHV